MRKPDVLSYVVLVFLNVVFQWTVSAQIKLPAVLSDGVVLQRNVDLTLRGSSESGDLITLLFKQHSFVTHADSSGKFAFHLPPQIAGGPYKMTFMAKDTLVLSEVYFGDVWISSGQSNMELTIDRVYDLYQKELQETNRAIRYFDVPDRYTFKAEASDVSGGTWIHANPAHIKQFSAVAYFFAIQLNDHLNVPIGIINASLGGSPVEAWMSESVLQSFPDAYAELQTFKNDHLIDSIISGDEARQKEWYQSLNGKDSIYQHVLLGNGCLKKDGWQETKLPGYWNDIGIEAVNGSFWFKKEFTLDGSLGKMSGMLHLGRIIDHDQVFVNGIKVGETGYQYPPRKYHIEPGVLKEGPNTILMRVINQRQMGGFVPDKPYLLTIGVDTIRLDTTWSYTIGTKMAPLKEQTFIRWKAGGLFNAMIAPITSFQVKGVIWYQGESNTKRPDLYEARFRAMINNWRAKWKQDEMPFLYVQLANFQVDCDKPCESNWAELRQAQLNVLKLKNTGMVVATDLGEWNDIHPVNKKDVGKRLAALAMRIAYNDSIGSEQICPVPISAEFKSRCVKVMVEDIGTGLKLNGGNAPTGFAISEDGIHYYWAKAKLKGQSIIVYANKKPMALRYGWSDNPTRANVVNSHGMPLSPFEFKRTP